MPTTAKQVSIFFSTTTTRANASYPGVASNTNPWLYTAANYNGSVQVFFEATLSASAGTATAALFTEAGAQVTGSEISTNNTGATRVRSGDILANLVDGTAYQFKIHSTGAGDTATLFAARIIIIQSGAVTSLETIYAFGGNTITTNANYEDDSVTGRYTYDSSKFDGTVQIYFEAFLAPSNGADTVGCALFDTSDNQVANSEVTLTGTTTLTRVRSSAITLVNGTTYKVKIKVSANTGNIRYSGLVITQTGATKTESYYPIRPCRVANSGAEITITSKDQWNTSEWTGCSIVEFFEAWLNSIVSDTASVDLNNGTSDVSTVTTTSTSIVGVRSGPLTLTNLDVFDVQCVNSNQPASGVVYYIANLIIQASLSGSGGKKSTMLLLGV